MRSLQLTYRNLIQAFAALVLLVAATGCGSDAAVDEPLPEQHQEAPEKCVVMLSTGIIERSRAASPAYPELMHTLRVVVLDAAGNVEINDYSDFGNSPQLESFRLYSVKPAEQKTFYLFANEESVPGLHAKLSAYTDGQAFDRTGIDATTFSVDDSKPLPMSSVYSFMAPEPGIYIEKDMYLVRAATKISFRFVNYRTSKITVSSIDINAIASEMYLMPHVFGADLEKTFDTETLPWIEWLKKVSDESRDNLDYPNITDPELTQKRGWIKYYNIPSAATHASRELSMGENGIELPAYAVDGAPVEFLKPVVTDEFYMNESRYNSEAGGTQQYTMKFHLTEYEHIDGDSQNPVFAAKGTPVESQIIKFDNLEALFRNTHVLVDVEIRSKITVQVIPYSEVALNPIFGLESNLELVKIEVGNDIYYYDRETGIFYDENLRPIDNPYFPDTDPVTGWSIRRDDNNSLISYYDAKTGKSYAIDKETEILDPDNNRDSENPTLMKVALSDTGYVLYYHNKTTSTLYASNKETEILNPFDYYDKNDGMMRFISADRTKTFGYYNLNDRKWYAPDRTTVIANPFSN